MGPSVGVFGSRFALKASIRAMASASVAASGVTLGRIDLLGVSTGARAPVCSDPFGALSDRRKRSSSASGAGAGVWSDISRFLLHTILFQ